MMETATTMRENFAKKERQKEKEQEQKRKTCLQRGPRVEKRLNMLASIVHNDGAALLIHTSCSFELSMAKVGLINRGNPQTGQANGAGGKLLCQIRGAQPVRVELRENFTVIRSE